MPPKSNSSFMHKNAVRYTLAASVTIATLIGAQSLAFSGRTIDDAPVDVLLPSATAVTPTIQASATTMPTSTPPLTNTPKQVSAPATELARSQVTVAATATAVQPTNTPSPTATATSTQPPTATQVPTRVVVAPQQPRPQSHSSRP